MSATILDNHKCKLYHRVSPKTLQGRWSRLKTGAAEHSEEKQSHVVALYKQLGVWGVL